MSHKTGFTLMEIIVVLVIIGALAAMAIPSYTTFMEQGMAQAAANNLNSMVSTEMTYYFNNGSFCSGAACSSLGNIDASLSLSISDPNYSYSCSGGNSSATGQPGAACAATRNLPNGSGPPVLELIFQEYPLPSTANPLCVPISSYQNYCPST